MKKFILASALCAMAFTACQEEDFGVTSKDLYKSQYNQKFENQFGKVDPNQDWDFTRAKTEYVTVADTTGPNKGYYVVQEATLNSFKEQVPEGQNNQRKVTSFTLTAVEATTFEIIPLYQGGADYNWSVEMIVNGTSRWTWTKGDGKIEAKYSSNDSWHVVQSGNSSNNKYAKTTSATQVRSKATTVKVEAGATIYFRINSGATIEGWFTSTPVGTHTSVEKPTWIGALDVPTPSNVNSAYTTKIITCEGYEIGDDYNEAAFMLVGFVPEVIFEDEPYELTSTKRYMMEDFGAIDWDFNDVVVDVTVKETGTRHYNTDDNTFTYTEGPNYVTTAKIAHLGGTYPVQVKVGDTKLPLISNPTNHEQTEAELAGTSTTHEPATGGTNPGWEPEAPAVTVEGYDAKTNNVKLFVYKDFDLSASIDNEKVWESTFPTQGSVPYIVATLPDAEWTAEGVSVTSTSWWNK